MKLESPHRMWPCRAMVSLELVVTAFLGISLLASIVSRKTKTPYTLVLVLAGIFLAAVSDPDLLPLGQEITRLNAGGLFVGLILPPLLFESMMSIKIEEFRAVSRPALLLATVGVIIATLVGGAILWRFSILPFDGAFLFAALIAPTDVATVLEVFRRVPVPAKLATLMETESVFNDATAIALFTFFLTSVTAASLSLVGAVANLVVVFGGGVLVGLGVAWGARQLQREASDAVPQVMLTLAATYGSYGLASSLGVSGLIAVAVAGLLYGNTVLFKIENKEVEVETRQFWGILAFIANTVAFLFIGLSTNLLSLLGSATAIIVAYSVVTVSRFASVYPILSLRGVVVPRLPWAWKNVAMLGGMRGALAIALVATLQETTPDFPDLNVIVNMTFGVAILSILLQGPLLETYAKRAFGRQQTLNESAPMEELPETPKEVEGETPKEGAPLPAGIPQSPVPLDPQDHG
jgi:Na+:H+ antiporter